MTFPYLEILRKAFDITYSRPRLWIFGFLIGGTAGFNLGGFNYFLPEALRQIQIENWKENWPLWLDLIRNEPSRFLLVTAIAFFASLFLIALSGVCKGTVIAAADRAAEDEAEQPIAGFLQKGRRYMWQIVGLQIFTTAVFAVLLAVFAAPIIYLFLAGSLGRGLVLLLLGLAVFFPASLVFVFLHIYGPIFLVVYGQRVRPALRLAFDLLFYKFRESLILAAFLIGLSVIFVLGLLFSIILVGLPVGVLGLLLFKLELWAALYTLLAGGLVIASLAVLIASAAFAVFQNVVWVLAVKELVQSRKLKEKPVKVWALSSAG